MSKKKSKYINGQERKITFPQYGPYTKIFGEIFNEVDLETVLPPKITDRTIKLGTKYSPDFACYPYKLTLGNFIESLELGANTIFQFNGEPQCRFKHFYKTQEFALKELGYNNFEMYGINIGSLFGLLRDFTGKPHREIWEALVRAWRKLKIIDGQKESWAEDKPNIGMIGQPHLYFDPTMNFGLEDKIKRLGANPFNPTNFTSFLKERADEKFDDSFLQRFIRFTDKERFEHREKAKEYFNGEMGGYAFASFYNLLWLLDKGVDGIVHLLPLSCTFETLIEDYVNSFCKKTDTPLLRIPVDENNSEANLDTRIETFIKLIKRKKPEWRNIKEHGLESMVVLSA
jgi:predicted nucleotide-binding protein (sugar kinase/HSP70/actin superfamily)